VQKAVFFELSLRKLHVSSTGELRLSHREKQLANHRSERPFAQNALRTFDKLGDIHNRAWRYLMG
jgi:hypothetical protein